MKNSSTKIPNKFIIIGISTVVLAIIILFILFFQINFNTSSIQQNDWSSLILGKYIQEPPGKLNTIYDNYEDTLSVEITELSYKQYKNYTENCKDLGFNVEVSQTDTRYRAYNQEGYELTINYYQDQSSLDLILIAPIQLSQITWPDNAFTQMLPTPKSTYGRIDANDETGFIVFLGNTSKEDFNDYILACSQKGFNLNSERSDTIYTAQNEHNNFLTIEYRGNNVIHISIQEAKFDTQIIIHYENDTVNPTDLNFYIDYEFIDIINTQNKNNYNYIFTKGEHVLQFENAEDNSINCEETITITNDEPIELEIHYKNNQINVKKKSH